MAIEPDTPLLEAPVLMDNEPLASDAAEVEMPIAPLAPVSDAPLRIATLPPVPT